MKFNYYIIASLPELIWEGDLKGLMTDFLDDNESVFMDYRPVIDSIILYNDIRNLELLLRKKTNEDTDYGDSFVPGLVSEEELNKFCEHPLVNQPDEFPDYMADYLVQYHDDGERLKNIQNLYCAYYDSLTESKSSFLSWFARQTYLVRTVSAAIRIQRSGLPLEDFLAGDSDIVTTILDHRNSNDFGLKSVFPEINELLAVFEKPVLDLEKELDLFILQILQQFREDDPFGDHVIYLYILSLFFRDRWVLIDEEQGKRVVEEILQG